MAGLALESLRFEGCLTLPFVLLPRNSNFIWLLLKVYVVAVVVVERMKEEESLKN